MKLENSCNAATLQSFTKERYAIHRFNVVSMECHNVTWNGTLFKSEPVAPVDAPDFLKVIPKSFALPIAYTSLHPNSPSRAQTAFGLANSLCAEVLRRFESSRKIAPDSISARRYEV